MIRRGAVLIGLGVALVAGASWWRSGAVPSPPPVAAAAPVGVGALGRVEPESRIRRLAPPGGMAVNRVDRLLVNEGDSVAAGQVLASFADAPQKDAAVAQAAAAVTEARAALERVRAAGRPSEIAAQRARIAALAAAEEIARRDSARSARLVPSGAETGATAERERFAAARTAAERAEAEAQLETLSRPRPEDVAVAGAQACASIAESVSISRQTSAKPLQFPAVSSSGMFLSQSTFICCLSAGRKSRRIQRAEITS